MSLGSLLVVTSTTRPLGLDLYVGRVIFETDTGRFWFYGASGWELLPLANLPRFRLAKSGTQSITSGVLTDLTWDTETAPNYDADGVHAGSNATITIPTGMAGIWTFGYTVDWAATGTSDKQAYLISSGTADHYAETIVNTGAVTLRQSGTSDIPVAAGETVKVTVFQASGGGINVGTQSKFWGTYRGAA